MTKGVVYGEQQGTKNRALRYLRIQFETSGDHGANFDRLKMIQEICCKPPNYCTSKAKPFLQIAEKSVMVDGVEGG